MINPYSKIQILITIKSNIKRIQKYKIQLTKYDILSSILILRLFISAEGFIYGMYKSGTDLNIKKLSMKKIQIHNFTRVQIFIL